jgi:hypothetical protein
MFDPILKFPRVIHERRDPSTSDDRGVGIIEGNIWINVDTGAVFICVDAIVGKWVAFILTGGSVAGGDFTFGDGTTPLDALFDLGGDGGGKFVVHADNVDIDDLGDLELSGTYFILNRKRDLATGDFWTYGYDDVNYDPAVNKDGVIAWSPTKNYFQVGHYDPDNSEWKYLTPMTSCVLGTRDPLPTDNFDQGYYLSQMWINTATQQKFTCVSCPPGEDAVWRLSLSSLSIKPNIESDDYIILYGDDDDTFMRISIDDFTQYMVDATGGFGFTTSGYGWILDSNDNITESEEDPITQGIFEADGVGDLQPITGLEADLYFEIDGDDNIQPKAA